MQLRNGESRPQLDHPVLDEYFLDHAFDEMFDEQGIIRPHYASLINTFTKLPKEELQRRREKG